ncbi:MAG: hypothetical protein C0404_12295 [Verrucomicrobia bacterium]|nr:hypothetical protein [Verrucomicrobiota bacterium]
MFDVFRTTTEESNEMRTTQGLPARFIFCLALVSGLNCAFAEDDPVIGEKPLSELLKQLRSENRGLQMRASQALSAAPTNLHARIAPQVMPVLKSDRENDKFVAAQILGEYGALSKGAMPDLLPMLEGTQYERNRAAAAKALGQIFRDAQPGPEVDKVTDALCRKFSDDPDSYVDVRRESVYACGRIGQSAKKCIPKLAAGLTDREIAVRRAAAWTCGRMGPLAAEHVDRLVSLMMTEGENAPEHVEALGLIGPVNANIAGNIMDKIETVDGVAEGIFSSNPAERFRAKALVALGRFGPKAAPAVPLVRRMAGGFGPDEFGFKLRTEIMNMLAAAGPEAKAALPEIEAGLRYNNYSEWRISQEDKVQLHKALHEAAARAYKAVTGNEPPKAEEKK